MTKAPERIWAEFGYDMRRGAFWDEPSDQSIEYLHIGAVALTHIEALEAENARLRETLKQIERQPDYRIPSPQEIARAALQDKETTND
jgi:hypothetical protein